jgi:hypothetical protein
MVISLSSFARSLLLVTIPKPAIVQRGFTIRADRARVIRQGEASGGTRAELAGRLGVVRARGADVLQVGLGFLR